MCCSLIFFSTSGKIRENAAVDKKSAYVVYEWPQRVGR